MPVTDGSQLRALSARLAAADAVGLRSQLRKSMLAATVPVIGDLKAAAASELPKHGGLNAWVAGNVFKTKVRLGAGITDVRIIHHDRDSGGGADIVFGTDRGAVRHPVFGHRDRPWVTQATPGSGWFTHTAERSSAEITPFVRAALEAVAVEVCRL